MNDPCRGDNDGMGDGHEPDGTAEWWSGVSTTDEHVEHMVVALRSARPAPGVDRLVLKDAAAMLFILHRELRQWRDAHERSPAEGEVSIPMPYDHCAACATGDCDEHPQYNRP
jgi:hypothetical protein